MIIRKLSDQFYRGSNIRNYKFNFKAFINEAMIQAELYHQCKLHNIECYLEVKVPYGILDAVINYFEKIIIIECKNNYLRYEEKKYSELKNQLKKYTKLEYPIFIIDNISHIEPFIQMIYQDLKLENKIYFYDDKLFSFLEFDENKNIY